MAQKKASKCVSLLAEVVERNYVEIVVVPTFLSLSLFLAKEKVLQIYAS
jgi:hypothetical protein